VGCLDVDLGWDGVVEMCRHGEMLVAVVGVVQSRSVVWSRQCVYGTKR
jgi:hypothetical protein